MAPAGDPVHLQHVQEVDVIAELRKRQLQAVLQDMAGSGLPLPVASGAVVAVDCMAHYFSLYFRDPNISLM